MKITIQNFRCFRKQVSYEFQNSRLTLLKGHSGAGKSTVLESIRWCLFGSLRNIYPSGFIPTATNKTFVSLEINGIKVTRSQSPESLIVNIPDYEKNENITITQDVAQKYLDSMFGNKEVWQASSFIRQNERCPLMTANNSERMSLLNEILFGTDNATPFENPDYYIEKIENEMEKVTKEITGQTAIYNTYYTKYVSGIQGFENTYNWDDMTLEKIQEFQVQIDEIKSSILLKTNQLLETSKLENKKKILEDRIKSLQDANSNVDLFATIDENMINKLTEELNSLQLTINKCVMNKTKYDSLQKEMDTQSSRMTSNHQELLKVSLKDLEFQINTIKIKVQEFEKTANDVRIKDIKKQSLKTQTESITNELYLNQNKVSSYPIQDVEVLKKILINSKSFKAIKDVESRITALNVITESAPEEALGDMISKYTNMLTNLRYSLQICAKYGMQLGEIKSKIEAYQKLIDFHRVQKEHLSNQKAFNSKNEELERFRKSLTTDFSIYSSYLQPELSDLSNITVSNVQELINLITTRLGSPLKCPHCSCIVEYNSGVLTIPKNEIIDIAIGKQRIEKLKELLSLMNRNSAIETTIARLENEIKVLQPFDEQIVASKQYTEQEILGVQALINECSRIETEFEISEVSLLEQKISEINSLKEYYKLKKELLKYQSEYDSTVQVAENIDDIQKTILELPVLQLNIERLISNKEKIQNELNTLGVIDSYEEISDKINLHKTELQSLEESFKSASFAHKLQEIISSVLSQMIEIDIASISSSNIEKLENEKTELQRKIIENKNLISVLKEHSHLRNELRSIVLITSSQIIQSQIETLNENLEQYNDMFSKAHSMYNLLNERTELEKVRNLIIELTSKQSNLNIMKQIVIDTTNCALEGLVASINNMTNSVLEELFDDSMVVELKLYKELKTGKNKVKPSVNLCAYYKGECFDNINNLSGGEQSRISLALTLALASIHTSPIVFLDEVMGALNADLREQCVEVIKNFLIERSNKTILSVEHNFIVGLFDDSVDISHT
jgi:DNA repair exonuclease SbcCD ATPase subunit